MAIRTFRNLLLFFTVLIICLTGCKKTASFDENRAYQDIVTQVSFGPRIPGSQSHSHALEYIQAELSDAGWSTTLQKGIYQGHEITNLISYRNTANPSIILGTHYDSRIVADNDQNNHENDPVPGANDGASGVAVLLELARTLPRETPPLWLVFFDAEDNGNIPDWDWILGSRYFVKNFYENPKAVIIIDMIGDRDLQIYQEANSDPHITQEIWDTANKHGYSDVFLPEIKYSMLDDHTPFIEKEYPAVLIIDFDYPYWHTLSDTTDKVTPKSLKSVGDTLFYWILAQH